MTDKQRAVLTGLARKNTPVTARHLADDLEVPRFRAERFSYQEVYSQLRRLERAGLVNRHAEGRAVRWTPSDTGTEAMVQADG